MSVDVVTLEEDLCEDPELIDRSCESVVGSKWRWMKLHTHVDGIFQKPPTAMPVAQKARIGLAIYDDLDRLNERVTELAKEARDIAVRLRGVVTRQ